MEPNEVWNVQDALKHLLAVTDCFCNKLWLPHHPCYRCRALETWKSAEAKQLRLPQFPLEPGAEE